MQHGQVSYLNLLQAKNDAKFMVGIGSKKQIILPSKIFEYIATGKPIVHIYYRKDAPYLFYLKKYPLTLLVYVEDDIKTNIMMLKDLDMFV